MQFVSQPGWLCPGWGLRVLVSACWVSFHPHLPPECWIPCETLAFPDNPQMTTAVVGEKCSSDNSQPHGSKGFYESFYEHCQDSLSGGEHVPQSHQPLHSLPWKNFFATVRKNHLKTRGNVRVPPMPQCPVHHREVQTDPSNPAQDRARHIPKSQPQGQSRSLSANCLV